MKYPLQCAGCRRSLLTRAMSVYRWVQGALYSGSVAADGTLEWCTCRHCACSRDPAVPLHCAGCDQVLEPVLTLVHL